MRLEHLLSGAVTDNRFCFYYIRTSCTKVLFIKDISEKSRSRAERLGFEGWGLTDSPIAQLVRALH